MSNFVGWEPAVLVVAENFGQEADIATYALHQAKGLIGCSFGNSASVVVRPALALNLRVAHRMRKHEGPGPPFVSDFLQSFYICVWSVKVFGKVIEGMDLVRNIETFGTSHGNPKEEVKIMASDQLFMDYQIREDCFYGDCHKTIRELVLEKWDKAPLKKDKTGEQILKFQVGDDLPYQIVLFLFDNKCKAR